MGTQQLMIWATSLTTNHHVQLRVLPIRLPRPALSEIIERAAPILGVSFLFPFFPREEAHIS
jgi:hypothetical protein